MIAAAERCGCGQPPCARGDSVGSSFSSLFNKVSSPRLKIPRFSCLSESTESTSIFSSSCGDSTDTTTSCTESREPSCPGSTSCPCGSSETSDSCSDDDENDQPCSEIAANAQPYKEIEAIINNNRMIVRMQIEKAKPDYDPVCDCIENPPGAQGNELKKSPSQSSRKHDIIFQKANENCRTINVYPQPDKPIDKTTSQTDEVGPPPSSPNSPPSPRDAKKRKKFKPAALPVIHPEENPNIFVLRIKRKSDKGEKKHSLHLEFKTPRPWAKKCEPIVEEPEEEESEDDNQSVKSVRSITKSVRSTKSQVTIKPSGMSDMSPSNDTVTRRSTKGKDEDTKSKKSTKSGKSKKSKKKQVVEEETPDTNTTFKCGPCRKCDQQRL